MSDGFSPPQQVRANAKRSLELRKKYGRGMTAVGVARARDLSNGKNISADTIKRMVSYFARHEVDKKGEGWGKDSAGYIAWLGWGGDAGRSWANKINRQLNAKESEEILESMASSKAAIVRGIFIKPGISKNRRLYTRENIGKAVERMKSQLAGEGGLPITMATSHGAAFKDDALSTVGRVTKVEQLPDGSASFEAEIANTSQGRDVAALATGKFIKGVSIRGEWMGNLETKSHEDGEEIVTAPDLRILGIDFTHSPGVEGAEIQYAALAESFASGSRYNIVESTEPVEIIARDEGIVANETASLILSAVEAAVESALEAKDPKKPYGDVKYADPGYQKDGKKRYPIDTAAHVRAAWSYINQKDNAGQYSPAQLSRVKSRIKSAAKKFGIEIQEEYDSLVSDIHDALEAYASIALVNDDDTISITGYTQDPHLLKVVANRIAFGAIAAMHAIDPDDDGDIYLSKPDWSHVDDTGNAGGMGPEEMDDDGDSDSSTSAGATKECHECGMECASEAKFCQACGEALQDADVSVTPDGDPTVVKACASCGTNAHDEESAYCHYCGERMPDSVAMHAIGCTTCGSSAPSDAMFCPACGDPVPQAEAGKTDYSKIIPNRKGVPANKDLYAKVIADAKEKFDVYPSAVANAWVSKEYKRRGGTYTTKSAESQDEALTQTKENTVSDENTTPDVAPAQESGLEMPATRTLSDADLQALASVIAAAIKPAESTEPAAEVVAEPEVAAEPVADDADAEPATEESNQSQETIVTENKMFSAEEVAAMIAEAAQKAASEAVEAATRNAIESYRTGKVPATRKGLVGSSVGTDASDLSEAEITPESLAEMSSSDFRKVQSEVWGNTNFFSSKFAQASSNF